MTATAPSLEEFARVDRLVRRAGIGGFDAHLHGEMLRALAREVARECAGLADGKSAERILQHFEVEP